MITTNRDTNTIKALLACTDPKTTRPGLRVIKCKNGIGYATDGFILASLPLDDSLDGLIPVEVCEKAQIIDKIGSNYQAVYKNGSTKVVPEPDTQFPDIDELLPEWERVAGEGVEVGLGLEVLESLVASMKAADVSRIKLQLPEDNNKCMIATPIADRGSEAIAAKWYLMPVKLD